METISGVTNWRLTIRREAEGVTILRAVTCDTRAVLPDELFGLPVTALADRALAHGVPPREGEEVLILGGAEEGEWDNRNITALTLPRPLLQAGDYAFMNLRRMEILYFYDDLLSPGSASFMNCRAFSRVELTRTSPRQGPALAAIVKALQSELDVTVRRTDGSTQRLIFPEYIENYTENGPAHYFQLKISGGGYAYHGVFRDKALSMSDYDGLWRDYLAAEHDDDSALRLAFCRLRFPAELSDRARTGYEDYLRKRQADALLLTLRERDTQGLAMVLALQRPDEAALTAALDEARALRDTGAVALLLQQRRRQNGGGQKYAL